MKCILFAGLAVFAIGASAAEPESADKIKELTAQMEKMRAELGGNRPLTVPDPQKAAWTPPPETPLESKKENTHGEETP